MIHGVLSAAFWCCSCCSSCWTCSERSCTFDQRCWTFARRLAGHSTRLAGHAARHSTRYVSHARYVGHARHAGHTAVHTRHSTQAARQSNMCTGHPTRHTTQVTRPSTSCHTPNQHQHQSRCHSGTTQGSSCPRTHHRLHEWECWPKV